MADDFMSGSIEEAAALIDRLTNQSPEPEPKAAAPEPQIQPQEADESSAVVEGNVSEEAEAPAIEAEPTPAVAENPQAQTSSPELEQKLSAADKREQEATAVRDNLLGQLNAIVPQLQAAVAGEFADIKTKEDLYALADPRSPSYNVERYNAAIIAFSKLNDAETARQKLVEDQQKVQNEKLVEWRKSEQTKIAKLIPELNDPAKGPVLAKKLEEFALKRGYTPQQLSMASAADFEMLHDAMQLRDLKAAQAAAKEKAKEAPPVQKPGAARTDNGTDKSKDLWGRAQKSGRIDDLAAYFDARGRPN